MDNNSVFCHHCKSWIHYHFSNVKDCLRPDPNFKCRRCCQATEITPAPQLKHVNTGNSKLEVVRSFCYLRDGTHELGGCYSATTPHIRSAWKRFYGVIPIMCNKSFSLAIVDTSKTLDPCFCMLVNHGPEMLKIYQGCQRQIIWLWVEYAL